MKANFMAETKFILKHLVMGKKSPNHLIFQSHTI